ncbi:hypothetical protein BDV23DRAFT_151496 [Aspergillus alliaceus]|uniref:Uncharacterized protein n=1 Tax=Petromyces alliaceus TaxID=209559 RepID=A0A5N7CEK0_PETAA|nr:hypothetical protein BDV23DRAFT_151496 [Aspergillus alliaceus]
MISYRHNNITTQSSRVFNKTEEAFYFIMASNTNPGNFSNRPQEEVQNIASKGGQSSHRGGFASMDPEKQVRFSSISKAHTPILIFSSKRNIASKGGQASSGSFEPGDPRARAAGQKGGSRTSYDLDQPEE